MMKVWVPERNGKLTGKSNPVRYGCNVERREITLFRGTRDPRKEVLGFGPEVTTNSDLNTDSRC